jgi:hypothetical protein
MTVEQAETQLRVVVPIEEEEGGQSRWHSSDIGISGMVCELCEISVAVNT